MPDEPEVDAAIRLRTIRKLQRRIKNGPVSTKGRDRAMNRFERLFGFRGEAKVKYLDGEFQVVSAGDYVLCAVTSEPIPLAELKYWSVALQEPYATAEASLQRYVQTRKRGISAD